MILVNAYCEVNIMKTEVKAEQSHSLHIFHANKNQSFFSVLFPSGLKHIGEQSFNFS